MEDRAWRLSLFGDELESIVEFDPLTGHKTGEMKAVKLYANSHYVTPKPTLQQAMEQIKVDLRVRLDQLTQMRSEEHTSELQSLMRISYAVFCLKKKRRETNTK